MEDLMKISLILCLILFVSCGKVKVGQVAKKGNNAEGKINQPQRAGGRMDGAPLDNAIRICNILNQKAFNFKTKYKGKGFSFKVTNKDCFGGTFDSTASGTLELEGADLIYETGAGTGFYKYEDSASSANFKLFCDNLYTTRSDFVPVDPKATTRWLYTITDNQVLIEQGERKEGTTFTTKYSKVFDLNGSGDFIGMISKYSSYGACSDDKKSSQTRTVEAMP
jgi:hypothetical protein